MERDFTYIDDIVDGIKGAIMSKTNYKHKIYNLGNSHPEILEEFVRLIEKTLKIRAKRNLLPIQPGDVEKTYADISESRKDLNFRPKTKISDGIPRFIKWYRNYYNV